MPRAHPMLVNKDFYNGDVVARQAAVDVTKNFRALRPAQCLALGLANGLLKRLNADREELPALVPLVVDADLPASLRPVERVASQHIRDGLTKRLLRSLRLALTPGFLGGLGRFRGLGLG